MNQKTDYEEDLASIRSLMERSSRFISLSGMSGVCAGIYALIGALMAYFLVYYPNTPFGLRLYYVNEREVLWQLLFIAAGVLAASLITGLILTKRKAEKQNSKIWDTTSKKLLWSVALPMIAGGLFIFVLITRGYFVIIAPACLLFYGLALVSGSHFTLSDVKYLGYFEILLGIISGFIPGYGLIFWAIGFGVLHILYGIIMYYKYDR
jgi:MFS family permease